MKCSAQRGRTSACRAAGLLLAVLLSGCGSNPPPPASGPPENSSSPSETTAQTSSPVDDLLQNAVYHLQPDHIDVEDSAVVAVLNEWMLQSGTFDPAKYGLTDDSIRTIPNGWLTERQRGQLVSPQFNVADATYVRNALLTKAMASYAAKRHEAELDRIVDLFDFTLRTVALQDASLPQFPFPLNEILLLGQGTADDRAWVFAALLKQQRIDSVILQAKDDPESRLVGVILEGDVYLFDTKLGVPIPRGDDPPSIRIDRPATIKEIEAHPEWWQALTLRTDQPYPWNSEQLANADVFIYAAEESWNGRMQQLELVLPPESTCALYDPLVDTELQSSLVKRILAGHAGWSAETLRFWDHPLNVRERVEQMGPQFQRLSIIFNKLRVPLEIVRPKKVRERPKGEEAVAEAMGKINPFRADAVFDMEGGSMKIIPSNLHWSARIQQLMGRFGDATTSFHRVRFLAVDKPPEQLPPEELQNWQQLYILAAIDASYWSAAAKVEQQEDAAAESALRDFLRRYLRTDWGSLAQYQLALILARQRKFSEAKTVIARLAPNDPHRPGLEILQKRWEGLDDEPSDRETSSDNKPTDNKPTDNKPADDKPADDKSSDDKPTDDKTGS